MNKRNIIIVLIILAVIIIAAAIGAVFLGTTPPATSINQGATGTLPTAVTSTPKTIPSGSTITLGTPKGSVSVNNFYKTAAFVTQDQQTVAIQQTSTYAIAYNVSDSSFVITILSTPIQAARVAAEAAFLNSLGISEQDACKLNVYEGVPASVSDQYVGVPLPLSFCNTGTVGGQ